jgi:di/tricarboxylate transporter
VCVTTNAVAAIAVPIALSASKTLADSYKPFEISVIMAASSGFAVPFAYACHLMVMGPGAAARCHVTLVCRVAVTCHAAGGYTLAHFVKIGLPLDIIIWPLCSWPILLKWPF